MIATIKPVNVEGRREAAFDILGICAGEADRGLVLQAAVAGERRVL